MDEIIQKTDREIAEEALGRSPRDEPKKTAQEMEQLLLPSEEAEREAIAAVLLAPALASPPLPEKAEGLAGGPGQKASGAGSRAHLPVFAENEASIPWGLAIMAILSAAMLAFGWRSREPQPAFNPTPAAQTASAAQPAPGGQPSAAAETAPNEPFAAPRPVSSAEEDEADPYAESVQASGLAEEQPPKGEELTLSASQIFYCLANRERMAGGQRAAAREPSAGAQKRFNAMVEDHNARCANFHYRVADFDAAQKEAARRKRALRREGAANVLSGEPQNR